MRSRRRRGLNIMKTVFAAFAAGLELAILCGTLRAAQVQEAFSNANANVWLSASNGDDLNNGLAPEKAVKTIARAYDAAKAAVDAQELDGTKQVVVAVDEGEYAAAMITSELTAGIKFVAVGARERTLVKPMGGTYGATGGYETAMACVNGEHPRVFEMEGFTFTGFNGDHHYAIAQYQSGIVYGMTLRECMITGNSPICTKAFVCGTFIDCDITGNKTRPRGDAGGDAPFGGCAAVYDDRERYQTRMYGCHVWDNDFSTFQFFAGKIEAKNCLFENGFAAVKNIHGSNNTMIADRYTNPLIPPSPSYRSFIPMGTDYLAVIASSADCETDPFYQTNTVYTIVQNREFKETRTTAVPVPYSWLLQHLPPDGSGQNLLRATSPASVAETPLDMAKMSNFESSAKLLGANGYRLWESYAIGLDPNDESQKLRITALPIMADGTPDIGNIAFTPALDKWNARSAKIVVKGTEQLSDGDWRTVTDENRASLRFFKVEAEFP